MGLKRAESLEDLRKKGRKAQKAKAAKRLSQAVAVKDWHEAMQVERDAPNPSPWQKMVAAYARQPYSTQLFVNFLLAMTVLGLCTAIGGFVFFALEKKQSDLALSNYVTYMNVLQAQLTSNTSNPTQGTLLYQVLLGNSPWTDGKGLQFSMPPPYQSNGDPIANGWALNDFQGFLFSFELLSTIGYGEIAPKSQGGQLWLCLFSLLTIPLAGVCLSTIAVSALDLMDVIVISFTGEVHDMWDAMARKGRAAEEDVRAAFDLLDRKSFSDEDWQEHCEEAKVVVLEDGTLTFLQVVRLYLTSKKEEQNRKMMRLYSSSLLVILWLIMGMLVFNHFEDGWGYVASFYFCFVTLTTIGLGDFYPSSRPGLGFHFFFCVTGLGLVAVLLNSIASMLEAAPPDESEAQEAAAAIASQLAEREKSIADDMAQMEAIVALAPQAAPLAADGQPQAPPPGQPGEQLTTRRVLHTVITRLSVEDKQRILRQILTECRSDSWLFDALLPYIPRVPDGSSQLASPGAPVVKVIGPLPPRRVQESQPVPSFKPSYTQLYDDEPYNLSGAPKPGFPLFGEGRQGWDKSGGPSSGPFDREGGTLAGEALGQLAMAQPGGAGDGGWGLSRAPPSRGAEARGDDRLPWAQSRQGGARPPEKAPFREDAPVRRL